MALLRTASQEGGEGMLQTACSSWKKNRQAIERILTTAIKL